jgi:hypothetical protein
MDRLEGAWLALAAECMNCSVLSLLSFMFYNRRRQHEQRPSPAQAGRTRLRAELEHVLERHARGCELALEQHHHVRLVLVRLLLVGRARAAGTVLADVRLQHRDLLVHARDVLLDDVREFLRRDV